MSVDSGTALRLLLVQDDPEDARLTTDVLRTIPSYHCDTHWVATYADALIALARGGYDAVVLNYRFGAGTGIDLLREVFDGPVTVPVILLTSHSDHDVDASATRAGIAYCVDKATLTGPALERALRYALERMRTEHNLRSARALFRAAFDAFPGNVAIVDADGTILDVNQGWTNFALANGGPGGSGPGVNYFAICAAANDPTAREAAMGLTAVLQGTCTAFVSEYPCHAPNEERWFRMRVTPFAGGGAERALVVHEEVTAQRLAEITLRESEAQHRALIEFIPDGIIISVRGTIVFANPAAARLLGHGSTGALIGQDIVENLPTAAHRDLVRDRLQAAALGATVPFVEIPIADAAGRERYVEFGSTYFPFEGVSGVLSVCRDAEARRRLAEQQLRVQRLDAIGQLAGGVAHDFNNLTAIIQVNADMLREELGGTHPGIPELQSIREAAGRAATLTRQLLAYSRKQIMRPKPMDLNQVLRALGPLVQRLVGEDVRLELALNEPLPTTLADPGQIEHVIMSLAMNARDAMVGGGRLRLATSVETVLPETQGPGGAPPGRYVTLSVEDSGTGMASDVLARAFEPYFTTRSGGSAGLGLSTVQGIVAQSRGHLTLDSVPGVGTQCRIILPAIGAEDERPCESLDASERRRAAAGSAPLEGRTILLVEDEPAMRAVLVRALERARCRVLMAGDGEEALHVASGFAERIDLIITDVVMPGMGGRELAEALSVTHPDVAVVFMSGYTDDEILRRGLLDPSMPFVQKPFTPRALLDVAAAAIAGRAAGISPCPALAACGDPGRS